MKRLLSSDLEGALNQALPKPLRDALALALRAATELNVTCYLVGGPVRDIVLGRPVDDVDLVLEGDAIMVAERFRALANGTLTAHRAFGTATVELQAENRTFHIDFVTARREIYPEPAALPVVTPSTLADDLSRRDFTINTLAISFHEGRPDRVIDQHGGLVDLEKGLVRILHDQSFVDDPTRILRAVRFAARLRFAVEEQTGRLIEQASQGGMIERTTPARILNEVRLAWDEPAPEEVFHLLHSYGALPHIVPGLRWTDSLRAAMAAVRTGEPAREERRLLLLGLIAWRLPPADRRALLMRYPFTAAERRVVDELDELETAIGVIERDALPKSALDRLLRGLDDTTLKLGQLVAPPRIQAALLEYRQALRPARTLLTGDDLRRLNIPPGPWYRTLLEGIRAAQLDGLVRSRAEAEQWVREQEAFHRGS